jgi:hypothetical protein
MHSLQQSYCSNQHKAISTPLQALVCAGSALQGEVAWEACRRMRSRAPASLSCSNEGASCNQCLVLLFHSKRDVQPQTNRMRSL